MNNQTPAEQLKYLAKELSQTCAGLEAWPKQLLPPEEHWREYRTHLARLIFLICHTHLFAEKMNQAEQGITNTENEEI